MACLVALGQNSVWSGTEQIDRVGCPSEGLGLRTDVVGHDPVAVFTLEFGPGILNNIGRFGRETNDQRGPSRGMSR